MGPAPAASPDYVEESRDDITFIRTDAGLPPVAIVDRSPITVRHRLIFGAVAVLGAIAWAAGFSLWRLLFYMREELFIVIGASSSAISSTNGTDASVKGHFATGSSSLTPRGSPPRGKVRSAPSAAARARSSST